MTDTRRAHPAYQLDVDLMMLEYTLHKATQAHIDEHHSRGKRGDADVPQSKDTLLEIYDTLLHTFKRAHEDHKFDKGMLFGMEILEFLVLFTQRESKTTLSVEAVQTAKAEGLANRQRRFQLYTDYRSRITEDGHLENTHDLETKVFQSWACYPGKLSHSSSGPKFLLGDLLHRFVSLSAQISAARGSINATWIALASEYLVQAGIEACTWAPEDAAQALAATFAWGVFDERALMDEKQYAELPVIDRLVNDMFLAEPSLASYRRGIGQEWMDARLVALKLFKPPGEARLTQLELLHPVKTFENNLLSYIEHLSYVGQQLYGTPVLVQIEGGGLEGLNDQEFDAFKESVGLGKHERRVARMKLPREGT